MQVVAELFSCFALERLNTSIPFGFVLGSEDAMVAVWACLVAACTCGVRCLLLGCEILLIDAPLWRVEETGMVNSRSAVKCWTLQGMIEA